MRYLIFSLILFLSISTIAQNTAQIDLDWSETSIFLPNGQKINTLTFTGASLDKKNNWLPEFSLLQKTGSKNDIFSVELLDTEFKLLSSTEKQILQNKSVDNSLKPTIKGVLIRKENYEQVRFIPIRRNKSTGQYEKLVQFKLRFKKQGLRKYSKATNSYVSNSVLQNGKWIKISVDTTSIHKITYDQLIDMGISNPNQVRIFGYGGGMLPKMNSETHPEDLPSIPIYLHIGSDGIFNSGDFLLFFAKGPRKWTYDFNTQEYIHENHLYSNQAYYFISSDQGTPNIISSTSVEPSFTINVDTFDDYQVIDKDEINLLQSGRLWLGQEFDISTNYSFPFNFTNLDTSVPIHITTHLAARSASNTKFTLLSGNTNIGEIDMPSVNTGSYTATYASLEEKHFLNFNPGKDKFEISLNYKKSSPSSIAWLDYLRLNARRKLIFTNDQMAFRDSQSVGAGNISRFQIQDVKPSNLVWDITNQNAIKQIPLTINGNQGTINIRTEQLKEFVIFNPEGSFPTPEIIGEIPNQNLHALKASDLIIICPDKFLSYANQVAEFHRDQDNLRVEIVSPSAIYNEFSSGTPDVAAIRNFLKMLYDNASNDLDIPKYLLLFGDGSYDNKLNSENNTNQILTYQSENSLSPTQSFVTDDFFGLLDDDEGESFGMVDIGIGRFPVNTSDEAKIVTSKILNYSKSDQTDWRSSLCFIGDDEDNNTHMRDANRLAEKVENEEPQYRVQRIFLDNYEQISNSSGQIYPDVNQDINNRVNHGTLIMNYTGHGNENGLAHEHILMLDDILSWKNPNKLPLFMTATCEFSRFDNYRKLSAGEIIFLRDNGGGIGLFTTTRLVFSSPNFTLNQNFYNYVFALNSEGVHNRLGDIMRKTKNNTSSGINKRNFTLLGDPALQLNYPVHKAITLKINDIDISQPTDTLKALSKVKISGAIHSQSNQALNLFNGTIFATIFDKASPKTTRGNDGNPFEYTSQTNILYKGKASVRNGNFKFTFFIPKDINYQFGTGKILYYAAGTDSDAAGYSNNIIIGGTNSNAINDKLGPEIKLYMNDELFSPGGMTDSNPLLLAIVQDSSGINTVGNAIGHDIVAILDQNTDKTIELNDFYESDLDNYQKGKITYRLNDLEPGEHELQLKVWDNVNNSNENNLSFVVSESSDLVIKHLLNYPNPFTTNTGFYFEHNQASRELDVLIQILTISGKLIKTIETTISSAGSRVGPISWDGKDDFGNTIGRGVYFYRVKVRADDGKVVNKFQKLVILK
ncbi:type IX secretion system sortase PorU [Ancylomarina longa]|uniref:T9SS C-terminal target domain-containing protein n=1 Tax=Ancylomarina longa TaxID=2487017 RepID=A0A434AGR7_9BACT|nr:type IX secretion system sortase PorU [Ancylomarina longa]RUT73581.1 T9SS C-terminal target domain-containing protein [Ancylomarina longa]